MTTITYKFRSSNYFQTISFERSDVNVLDFKKGVIFQGNFNDTYDDRCFDLVVANQRTGEEYRDNNIFLPRRIFLVVHQVPATEQRAAKLWDPPTNPVIPEIMAETIKAPENISPIEVPIVESKKVVKEISVCKPGPNYVCHRCGIQGHWIRNCPTNDNKSFIPVYKRALEGFGLPTVHSRVPVENPSEKPDRIIINGQAVSESALFKIEIPSTFRCDICHGILRVATVVPCCKKSFCKECIMQRIWRGGHCPVCYLIVKADKLQIDKPLQERVNAFSTHYKREKKKSKVPMDEYVQKKRALSIPQVPTSKFTSFRHKVKPSFMISCLNCNEKGHVFKDCPKLEVKDCPSSGVTSTQVETPNYVTDPLVILPDRNSLESSSGKTLEGKWTNRYVIDLEKEYRKSRKKRRRSSYASSSISSSRSISRKKRKRRRRRARSRSRKRRSRRRKYSPSSSPASVDHSSPSHRKQKRGRSRPKQKRSREYRKNQLSSNPGSDSQGNCSDHGDWPVIRKPPPPTEQAQSPPLSIHSSSGASLSLSPPPGWRKK